VLRQENVKSTARFAPLGMQQNVDNLDVVWRDGVCNRMVATGLPQVNDIISTRQAALFGHVVKLGEQTPSHHALKLAADARSGCPPSPPHPGDGLVVDVETHG